MAVLEGFERLDAKLLALGTPKQIKGVARNAIRVGQRVVVKGIKAQIPGRYKDARKGIGYSLKAGKGENAGTVVAKVGVGVGKKKESDDAVAGRKAARKAAKQRGVGISARNEHWFVMGTGDRYTGARTIDRNHANGRIRKLIKRRGAKHHTGKMPAKFPGIVQRGVATVQSEAAAKIKQNMADGIAKLAK